jgi:hypothetical protein
VDAVHHAHLAVEPLIFVVVIHAILVVLFIAVKIRVIADAVHLVNHAVLAVLAVLLAVNAVPAVLVESVSPDSRYLKEQQAKNLGMERPLIVGHPLVVCQNLVSL